jgi:outer membrane protein
MKRLCGLLAIMALVAMTAQSQIGPDLSLSDAVEAALQSQPLTRSARLGIDLAEKRVTEARAGRLPYLRLSQTVTHGNNPVFVFGSLLEQGRFGPQNFSLSALNNPASITNVRTAVSANLPAFDGLKTSAHVAEAKIQRDQSVLQKSGLEQRVRFDVLRQYLGVLVAQANRQVADEAVRMAESDLNRTKDRVDAGIAVESDRLSAQVQLSEFTQQQIESEGNLATAVVALNVSIGSAPQAQHNLIERLTKKRFDVPRQEELIQRATLHRPEYLQANSGIHFAERKLSERRSDYLPELNLFGSFGNSGRNWSTGSTDYAVGAAITLNLFDPGRTSRVGQAHIEEELARNERDRVGDQIVVEVARAYQQYRSAVQQLEVAEATQAQATEALRIIQDRYDAGLTTITDLLRAETALVRARMNVTSANEAVYMGYANILLAIGELNDVHAFES